MKIVAKRKGGGEKCVLEAKGLKPVQCSSFIIESEIIIAKTEESKTTSKIVLFRNMWQIQDKHLKEWEVVALGSRT